MSLSAEEQKDRAREVMKSLRIGMMIDLYGYDGDIKGELSGIKMCPGSDQPVCEVCIGKIMLSKNSEHYLQRGYCPVFCGGHATFNIIKQEEFFTKEEFII